jgi:hypothetical protein
LKNSVNIDHSLLFTNIYDYFILLLEMKNVVIFNWEKSYVKMCIFCAVMKFVVPRKLYRIGIKNAECTGYIYYNLTHLKSPRNIHIPGA